MEYAIASLRLSVRTCLKQKTSRQWRRSLSGNSGRLQRLPDAADDCDAPCAQDAINKLSEKYAGWDDATKVYRILRSFQLRGHLAAKLDPLRGSLHRNLNADEPISWRIGGRHGHVIGNVDVIRLLKDYPRLDLSVFGLEAYSEEDELPAGVNIPDSWIGGDTSSTLPLPSVPKRWTFRNFIEHLESSYSGTLAIEYRHIENAFECAWLEEKFESRPNLVAAENASVRHARQKKALWRLIQADQLELLFGRKYKNAKRFGIEGCEALLPGLWSLLERAADLGVDHVQFGMAHRGRLNVLVNVLGKEVSTVCSEFGEHDELLGDVKYHLGTTAHVGVNGYSMCLTLSPNPSHLEAVNPVVLGMTRAKQDSTGDASMRHCMAVLLHGDAAFCGQGVVAESMQLADLPAYTTGGTVHIVINNLVGFTTDPRFARSSYHCTNIAKTNDAPILHVNADDIDAVLFACDLAAEYRQTFRKDIVVDLVSYRRYGHSEQDDGAITQPLTHNLVKRHPSVFTLYSQQLVSAGIISQDEVDGKLEEVYSEFEASYQYAQSQSTQMSDWMVKEWTERPVNVTGLPQRRLVEIGNACSEFPEDFAAHQVVKTLFEARRRQLNEGRVDWALAEQLAIGSLLLQFDPENYGLTTGFIDADNCTYVAHPPCRVRLSGQDVERGTFNHRHGVIYDQRTAQPYCVFEDMKLGPQSNALICNSSLSENAILGFEYGYSLEEGLALTIWEAQFGDFANCAQPVIDNFIVSGESKWNTKSCLVLLLPHGYEGQGPEHSSARLERFLQLVDDDVDDLWPHSSDAVDAVQQAVAAMNGESDRNLVSAMHRIAQIQEGYDRVHNISVVNLTTPANVFHALRRQVHRMFAKPLIVMTGKYLLQHRPCRSPLAHMAEGTRFQPLIMEGGPGDNMPSRSCSGNVRRIILCSGKIFYELHHLRAARKMSNDIALARMEQIAPFPSLEIAIYISRHPTAEIVWVQEEPKNMGAWTYVSPRLATVMRQLCEGSQRRVHYIGRPPTANPATAVFKLHRKQSRKILDQAISLP